MDDMQLKALINKPDNTPLRAGDRVVVLSEEEIRAIRDSDIYFNGNMRVYCGMQYEVVSVNHNYNEVSLAHPDEVSDVMDWVFDKRWIRRV